MGGRIQTMKKAVAVDVFIGLGTEAVVTQKRNSKRSKSVSISGRKMSEREAGC